MAILNISLSNDEKTVILQPINATVPDGYKCIGNTGTGVTYYRAVQELLSSRGILRMANITIKFDDLSTTLATLKKIEELQNKTKTEPEEKVVSADALETKRSSGLFI